MKIVNSKVEVLSGLTPADVEYGMKLIEVAMRTCYKSEGHIQAGTAEKMVRMAIKNGHESVIEHWNCTVKFIVDRGVSHEIVRHRIASYSQESTRYCNYSNEKFGRELTFIRPELPEIQMVSWMELMKTIEKKYMDFIDSGIQPQAARSILPNSLKTEVVMTANMREWRHFLKLRTSKQAHPDMRKVAVQLLEIFAKNIPVIFEDIMYEL